MITNTHQQNKSQCKPLASEMTWRQALTRMLIPHTDTHKSFFACDQLPLPVGQSQDNPNSPPTPQASLTT